MNNKKEDSSSQIIQEKTNPVHYNFQTPKNLNRSQNTRARPYQTTQKRIPGRKSALNFHRRNLIQNTINPNFIQPNQTTQMKIQIKQQN